MMKKNNKKWRISAVALAMTSLLTACQDLKDTYADYAGDGEIRYIGMCDNLEVSPGWQRVILKWTNNTDPIINKIKLKWSNDDMADSVLLERGTTEYSIPLPEDASYKLELSSLDKEGNASLSNSIYGRPYTENHEEVLSFSRVIAKQYFLGGHLVLLFSGWQQGIESAVLKYTKKDGTAGELALNADIASRSIYELPDEIDPSKAVTLYRKGRIGDCADLIEFAPYELGHQPTYTSDFKELMKKKYGTNSEVMDDNGAIRDSWAQNVETLEIDGDLNSLEDLLAMPKVKKLVIGHNTYLTTRGADDETHGQYKIFDADLSKQVLDIMHQQTGLVVERYNKHYTGLNGLSYLKEMGAAELPSLEMIDMSKASISVTPADEEGYNSHPEFLLDGNLSSCWKPLATSSQQNYVFTVDLGHEVEASGVKVVQKYFDEYAQDQDLIPQKISMQYADKSGGFLNVTYTTDNYIGTSTGQTILLPFAGGMKKVRYLKFIIPSMSYFSTFDVTLAEVGLYR